MPRRGILALVSVLAAVSMAVGSLVLPRQGETLRLEGVVTGVCLTNGAVDLELSRLVDAGHRETTLDGVPARLLLGVVGPPVPLVTAEGERLRPGQLTIGRLVALTLPAEPQRTDLPWPVTAVAAGNPELPEQWPWVPSTASFRYSEAVTKQKVVVPMAFPVIGRVGWHDTFQQLVWGRPHLGQDLCAAKMTPLVACFPGRVVLLHATRTHPANTVVLVGDNGWEAVYTHLNNDTPGTANNGGSGRYAFAPGLRNGCRVRTGQFLGWMGDSGQASGPHLHFELHRLPSGLVHNATPSLKAAVALAAPSAPRVDHGLRAGPGQTVFEAVVLSNNPSAQRLYVALRTRREPAGKVRVMTQYVAVILDVAGPITVLGRRDGEVPLAAIPAGSYLSFVGTRQSGRWQMQRAVVEWQGLLVDPELRARLTGDRRLMARRP